MTVKNDQELTGEHNRLINTIRVIDGSKFTYLRPVQVRTIPLKYGSNRGVIPSLKLDNACIEYESQLERDFYFILDHDPSCIDFQPQPWKITYKDDDGKEHVVFPDCWAIFSDGREFLFDIKPEHQYRKLIEEGSWKARIKAIEQFCTERGWQYQVMTDKRIKCVRLDNIKDMLNAARFFSPSIFKKDIGAFSDRLSQYLKGSPKKFQYILEYLVPLLPVDRAEVISLLKRVIYQFHLFIDWDVPFQLAEVHLEGEFPVPAYKLPEVTSNGKEEQDEIMIDDDRDETIIIPTASIEHEFKERLELIKPIIERHGKHARKSDIQAYCEKNGQSFSRMYRWYRIWKDKGEPGLYSRPVKKHDASHVPDKRVERLLRDAVDRWNTGDWRQMTSVYEEFRAQCMESGLEPVSYETFRRRVRALPASERKGKYKPRTQSYIKRGLTATYGEARYPCAVIQMDHTQLDIRCIDSFSKQDYGRVHCTIGVDAFSRSIWTFYLSFESPSQETVTKAILKGLTQKEGLDEWRQFQAKLVEKGIDPGQYHYSCHGFPTILQVDNGKDFQAESVKNFCMNLGIILESRPVKTPEYGGFIESVWDTINDAIRNANLDGRVFSMPKTREACSRPKYIQPPGYDARKTSALTIDEFGEWLFSYIVTNYSGDTRARQNHSPDETWNDGLAGNNFQPMGGALVSITPFDHAKLDYFSRISASCTLSNRGIRYKNVLYTSDWLVAARKKRILRDGETIEFKVSHQDMRFAWMINPETREIETLGAYNFDGDDRVRTFLLRGMGKIQGYGRFAISLKMIEHSREMIGKSTANVDEGVSVMGMVVKDLVEKGKINKKKRRFVQALANSGKAKERTNLAGTVADIIDDDKTTMKSTESKSRDEEITGGDDDKDEEIVPMPTSWAEAKKQAIVSRYMEDDGDDGQP